MKLCGIDFVPFNTTLEERLQRLGAFTHAFSAYFFGVIGIFLCILLLFTRLWLLVPLYICWLYYDRHTCETGGRRDPWLQKSSISKHCTNYFNIKLLTAPGFQPDTKRNYLFASFPHGIVPLATQNALFSYYSQFHHLYPKFTVYSCLLPIMFWLPIIKEWILAFGNISSSAKSLNYVLSRPEGGHIALLWPGGAPEAYYSNPGEYKFLVKKRKGFIKIAIKNGSPLVPVIAFGECDLYYQIKIDKLKPIQEIIRKITGFAPVLFNGCGLLQNTFGIIPKQKPVTVVVGTPIETPKIENPQWKQVEELHQVFVEKLIELFEEYKYECLENPEETHLELE